MGMNDTLLGALIGSLGTLLPNALNKMFEIFQKRQDHRQQHDNLTQKDLFDRKIKIAEAAISQYSQLKTIASIQRQFFDALLYAIRYKIPLEGDVLLSSMKKTELLIEQIKPNEMSLVPLYFDIKDFSNQNPLQDIIRLCATLKALQNALETKDENNSAPNEDITNKFHRFIISMIICSKLLKTLEDEIAENISIIKSGMKEFQAI